VTDDALQFNVTTMSSSELRHDFVNSLASVLAAASTIVEYRPRLSDETLGSLARVIVEQARRMALVFDQLVPEQVAVPRPLEATRELNEIDVRRCETAGDI